MTMSPVVEMAIKAARNAVAASKYDLPPIDLFALSKELGISSVEPAALSTDGYLGRQGDGSLAIRYRCDNSERRNRFTIAHELAHLILAGVQGKEITRSNRARV